MNLTFMEDISYLKDFENPISIYKLRYYIEHKIIN